MSDFKDEMIRQGHAPATIVDERLNRLEAHVSQCKPLIETVWRLQRENARLQAGIDELTRDNLNLRGELEELRNAPRVVKR